jgi:L-alanine-DL-glutamate epimerase-like enolase superfamily enzyme
MTITIESAELYALRIPFTDGSDGVGLMPTPWTHLEFNLLRLQADDGTVGWGDAFSYACQQTVHSAINEMVLPHVLNRPIESPAAINRELQQRLHLQGRYGISQFAISAVDIALWDIAAKQAGQSLATFLGGRQRETLPAYASLVRYTRPELVDQFVRRAVSLGYQAIKLHEITAEAIQAGRDAAPEPIKLVTDVNCNWTDEQAAALMPLMKQLNLYWVEEPLFPPDSEQRLGQLQQQYGVAIASGENACTAVEFERTAPHIRFVQPSVTKVGGITEFLAVCDLASRHDARVMPHSPYFGPGYQATVQLMAAREECEMFEHFFLEPEAYLDPSIDLSANGQDNVPDRPGLGFEPDPAILARYRI